jgi:phosphate transport system substrate-binding protein
MIRKLLVCSVSAAALSFGVASAATTTLNGGGSSLAEPTYINEFNLFTGSNPNVLFSYEGVGSGSGQKAFLGNDISYFENLSSGILTYGTIVGTTVHFGASDAYLVASQLTNPATGSYGLSGTDGPLIQVPTIGVAVSLPYVNSGLKGTLSLTDDQVCGILSGKLTNWNQIANRNAVPGTIQVTYRADGSGTTFLLLNHLNAVCTPANSSFPTYPVPVTNSFASIFPNSTPPSNFTGESGSAAVQQQMLATPLSFGYLSPDYTSIAPKSANTSSLKVAVLVNGVNGVGYAPTVLSTELGLDNAGPGSTNPTPPTNKTAAMNPLNWVPSIPVTNKGYPIVGYTTWDLSSCYASAGAGANLQRFLKLNYSGSIYRQQIFNNGFAPIPNTAAAPFVTAINNVFLSNASGYNLNIDNATLCAGLPGR